MEQVEATEYFAVIPENVLYSNIGHLAVRIYGVLRRHADQQGTCHPGRTRIAKLAHTNPRSVDRAIRELVEHGYITVHHRRDPDNPERYLSNKYVIHSTPRAQNTTPRAHDTTPLAPVTPPPRASDAVTKAKEPEPNNQFDEWWKLYPKKVNKQNAIKAWKAHTKKTKPEHIIEATRRQLNTPDTALTRDPQYIPYPASWLNAGSYENETTETNEPPRAYDQPKRPECQACDSTGWTSYEDDQGRYYATKCEECNP